MDPKYIFFKEIDHITFLTLKNNVSVLNYIKKK